MSIDTPATIAILGAGPIGLEAALYARYLGYRVEVYEQGRVGEHLLRWGHVRMFSPARYNVSPLGVAALRAQDPSWRPPDDDALLTGREFVAAYLRPLAESDLLADSIHEQTRVLAVGRSGFLKPEGVGDPRRGEADFRLLLRTTNRQGVALERSARADAVIDASGTFSCHNWLGDGGIPAPGETAAAERIEYGLPDVLGADRGRYAGQRVLLVGGGYSAATSAVALAQLAEQAPGTRITWATRSAAAPGEGVVRRIAADRLPSRDELARRANALAQGKQHAVEHRGGVMVEAIETAADGALSVRLAGEGGGELDVDRIIANVGYRPDRRLYRELQVHECYATEGPMKLAAAMLGHPRQDCLDTPSGGPAALLGPEPDFYILGAKSFGRGSQFLLSIGLAQIRELFTILLDRADLDVYATVAPLAGRAGGE